MTQATRTSKSRTAWILAGGTGGHIFPALAVAQVLQKNGWRVRWVGAPDSMEKRIADAEGIAVDEVDFAGVRGKGIARWLKLPVTLFKAVRQSQKMLHDVKPDVVLGFGGYISFPAGLAALLSRVPLVLHEQNSVAGMANKWLSYGAAHVFTAFPDVLKQGEFVGNPLRKAFVGLPAPKERFEQRFGRLRLLVVGGSQGATALNTVVPKALALMSESTRPDVLHQSGERHLPTLQKNYEEAGVQAATAAFIDDMASALAYADVVLCRSGASTVTEVAAVGVGAIFVPFPYAVDDHQTTNAMYLVSGGGGRVIPQDELTPEALCSILTNLDHQQCMRWARAAHKKAKLDATEQIVAACETLATSRMIKQKNKNNKKGTAA